MRLTFRPFQGFGVLATLVFLSACVAPGGNRSVDSAVNPVSGTTVTVETVKELPKPKVVKRVAPKPAPQPAPAPAPQPTPVAKTLAPAPVESAPLAAPQPVEPQPVKPVRKSIFAKKVKPLPEPVAGQVDASLDAITAEAAPDEAVKAQPKPTEEAAKPKSPEEVAAEALMAATAAEPLTPLELQTPEQANCLKKGGVWATAGKSGAKACVKRTKDAGKSCTKQTQCEGYCLARSGTCAPITPMFGCTDILQADGREVTLCLD